MVSSGVGRAKRHSGIAQLQVLQLPTQQVEPKGSPRRYWMIEGSLEVQLPTIWRDEKQSREAESEESRVRRKKMHARKMLGKSRNAVFFQWFVGLVGRKVGSLKRRVRSHVFRGEMKNCTPLWREAHFQVKMYKAHHARTTFRSCDVEKWHAAVARSTFASQNVQNTSGADHFLKLRCLKIARRCGAKHICKSKCTKHTMLGPLFEVRMSKNLHAAVARSTFPSQNAKKLTFSDHFLMFGCQKMARRCGAKHISKSKCKKTDILGPLFDVWMSKNGTPLWREAYFKVKMLKNWRSRTTFWSSDVEKWLVSQLLS